MQTNDAEKAKFTPYQVIAIVLLTLTQFTVVLDFMVMSPLGDMLMKSMSLSTSQFGLAVSAYAFSAGASGLMTAGFADRFDRLRLVLLARCRLDLFRDDRHQGIRESSGCKKRRHVGPPDLADVA